MRIGSDLSAAASLVHCAGSVAQDWHAQQRVRVRQYTAGHSAAGTCPSPPAQTTALMLRAAAYVANLQLDYVVNVCGGLEGVHASGGAPSRRGFMWQSWEQEVRKGLRDAAHRGAEQLGGITGHV